MITRKDLVLYRRISDKERRSPEWRAFRRELEACLLKMPHEYRQAILLHYCCRLSWVSASMRMFYSPRHCIRINNKACTMVERISKDPG